MATPEEKAAMAKAAAIKATAEKEAKELAEKEAKELAEKEAKELAEKEAKELAEKEAKEKNSKKSNKEKLFVISEHVSSIGNGGNKIFRNGDKVKASDFSSLSTFDKHVKDKYIVEAK